MAEDENGEEGFGHIRQLASDCIEMLVSVGIIDSISGRWPPDVQEAWRQKLEGLRYNINATTAEVQEFASAWDDHTTT
jgi:hypothetical protein